MNKIQTKKETSTAAHNRRPFFSRADSRSFFSDSNISDNQFINQSSAGLSNIIQRQVEDCPENREIEPEHPGNCPEITRDPGERQRFEALGPSMRMLFPYECYVLENLPINGMEFGSPSLLTEIADYLQFNPGTTVHLTGFSDCLGSESTNARIRTERAFAVEEYLISVLGVNPNLIFIENEADSSYLAANDQAYGRAMNRAVAIYLDSGRPLPQPAVEPDPELEPEELLGRALTSDEECALQVARSMGTAWLTALPDCPCSAPVGDDNWSESSGTIACFHPGAESCYRQDSGTHAQQCCYDDDNRLITGGSAAGTPDWASSSGLDHQQYDVWTWRVLQWELYNRYWAPNNDLECEENVVTDSSSCMFYHFALTSRPNPCRVR